MQQIMQHQIILILSSQTTTTLTPTSTPEAHREGTRSTHMTGVVRAAGTAARIDTRKDKSRTRYQNRIQCLTMNQRTLQTTATATATYNNNDN